MENSDLKRAFHIIKDIIDNRKSFKGTSSGWMPIVNITPVKGFWAEKFAGELGYHTYEIIADDRYEYADGTIGGEILPPAIYVCKDELKNGDKFYRIKTTKGSTVYWCKKYR